MINIRTLKKLNNNDGLTLKKGAIIEYKTGWQVATEGVETCDLREAMKAIKEYNGNCGIWFSFNHLIMSVIRAKYNRIPHKTKNKTKKPKNNSIKN